MPALVALVGLYFALRPWSEWPIYSGASLVARPFQHGLPQVGDALIIGAVLMFLADKAVKKELLLDFAQEVSHHMVGYKLPPELRQHGTPLLHGQSIITRWKRLDKPQSS